MRPCRLILPLLVSALLWLPGAAQPPRQQLTVYAATSLTDAFEALAEAFMEAEPEVGVLLNFSSSSTLAAQIKAGAPADIFASANEKQMTLVIEDGRVDESEVAIFAHNQLALILSAESDAAVESVADLAEPGILLVLAAVGTPIRAYTDAMLASYEEELGGDFQERVMRNLVSEERNVRQVVARVTLGEADAGIVYQSDAIGDVRDDLVVLPIAEARNQLASYPIAPIADSPRAGLAARFIAFALTEPAQEILRQAGFCSPVILDETEPSEATPEASADAAEEPSQENGQCRVQPPPD